MLESYTFKIIGTSLSGQWVNWSGFPIVFQGAAKGLVTTAESQIFWLSLVVAEIFWVVILFGTIFTFKFKWLVSEKSSGIILCMQPANERWCYSLIGWAHIENDPLTHWGQVMHFCVGNLTIIGSDNGLSPGQRQAIVWTNAGILLIGPLWTNFSEILFRMQIFSFKKMHLKMASAKWRPFCLGLNVLTLYVLFFRYFLLL